MRNRDICVSSIKLSKSSRNVFKAAQILSKITSSSACRRERGLKTPSKPNLLISYAYINLASSTKEKTYAEETKEAIKRTFRVSSFSSDKVLLTISLAPFS